MRECEREREYQTARSSGTGRSSFAPSQPPSVQSFGMGFSVRGWGFRVLGSGLRVQDSGFRV